MLAAERRLRKTIRMMFESYGKEIPILIDEIAHYSKFVSNKTGDIMHYQDVLDANEEGSEEYGRAQDLQSSAFEDRNNAMRELISLKDRLETISQK